MSWHIGEIPWKLPSPHGHHLDSLSGRHIKQDRDGDTGLAMNKEEHEKGPGSGLASGEKSQVGGCCLPES